MYDPKGFSPYGVCRCNYYRTVFCIVYNVDSEMWLNDTHRRYFLLFHCNNGMKASHCYVIRTLFCFMWNRVCRFRTRSLD